MHPFFVWPAGQLHAIRAKDGSKAVTLPHEPMTKDEAEFLCAHMNRAYEEGWKAGSAKRAEDIREVLGL